MTRHTGRPTTSSRWWLAQNRTRLTTGKDSTCRHGSGGGHGSAFHGLGGVRVGGTRPAPQERTATAGPGAMQLGGWAGGRAERSCPCPIPTLPRPAVSRQPYPLEPSAPVLRGRSTPRRTWAAGSDPQRYCSTRGRRGTAPGSCQRAEPRARAAAPAGERASWKTACVGLARREEARPRQAGGCTAGRQRDRGKGSHPASLPLMRSWEKGTAGRAVRLLGRERQGHTACPRRRQLTLGASRPKRSTSHSMRRKRGSSRRQRCANTEESPWLAHSSLPPSTARAGRAGSTA